MDPATACGWGQATKGLLYHCPVLLDAKRHRPSGRPWPEVSKGTQAEREDKVQCPWEGVLAAHLRQRPLPAHPQSGLGSGLTGGLFRCISLRGKDVTVTKSKLCCGNDARRKQEKGDRIVNGALAEGRNRVQSTPPCVANVPQHPKKHILSPFPFIVL